MTAFIKGATGFVPVEVPLMKVSDTEVAYHRNGAYDFIEVPHKFTTATDRSHKWDFKFKLKNLKVRTGLNKAINFNPDYATLFCFWCKPQGGDERPYARLYVPQVTAAPGVIDDTTAVVTIERLGDTYLNNTRFQVPRSVLNKPEVSFEVGGGNGPTAKAANPATLTINGTVYTHYECVDAIETYAGTTHTTWTAGGMTKNAGVNAAHYSYPFDAIYDTEFTDRSGASPVVTAEVFGGTLGNSKHNLSTLSPWQPPRNIKVKDASGWKTGMRAYWKPPVIANGATAAVGFMWDKGNNKNNYNVELKLKNCAQVKTTENNAYSDLFLQRTSKASGTSYGYCWIVHYFSTREELVVAKFATDASKRQDYHFPVTAAMLQGDVTIRINNNGIDSGVAPSVYFNGNEIQGTTTGSSVPSATAFEASDTPYPWMTCVLKQHRNVGGLGGVDCDGMYDVLFEYTDDAGVPNGATDFYPMDDVSNTFKPVVFRGGNEVKTYTTYHGYVGSSAPGEWFYE